MAGFRELWPLGGVGPWDSSVFMMLPKGGARAVGCVARQIAGPELLIDGSYVALSQEGRHG